MQDIILTELGYYHPSTANWNYKVWLIIDETGAKLYRETFGGDSRVIEKLEKLGKKADKMFAGKGTDVQYKWKNIKDLQDIEDYNGKNW